MLSLEVCGQIRIPQTVNGKPRKPPSLCPSHSLEADPYHSFKVEKEQQLALQVLQVTLDGQLLFVLFYLGGSQTAGGVTA